MKWTTVRCSVATKERLAEMATLRGMSTASLLGEFAGVAQMEEQLPRKQRVLGSTPSAGSFVTTRLEQVDAPEPRRDGQEAVTAASAPQCDESAERAVLPPTDRLAIARAALAATEARWRDEDEPRTPPAIRVGGRRYEYVEDPTESQCGQCGAPDPRPGENHGAKCPRRLEA